MPELQESDASSDGLPAAETVTRCEGVCPVAGEVIWERSDWDSPVGFFSLMKVVNKRSKVRDHYIDWACVRFPRVRLAHKAALLLLQGQALSSILIPNHALRVPQDSAGAGLYTAGHVLLRCNPWDLTLPVPELTGVVVAKLGEIPDGISSAEVLAALVHDSAA
jgi:hypothetical protein